MTATRIPHLPDGYTVERDERPRKAEVTWTVLGPDGARVSDPRVHRTQRVEHLGGDGDEYRVVLEWVVHPGFTTAGISVADARARAAVLLLAADEAEGRNER